MKNILLFLLFAGICMVSCNEAAQADLNAKHQNTDSEIKEKAPCVSRHIELINVTEDDCETVSRYDAKIDSIENIVSVINSHYDKAGCAYVFKNVLSVYDPLYVRCFDIRASHFQKIEEQRLSLAKLKVMLIEELGNTEASQASHVSPLKTQY